MTDPGPDSEVPTRLGWIDRRAEGLVDRLNPILVREGRQALASNARC